MRRRAKSFFFSTLICSSLALPACNLDNAGDDPPEGLLYMPAGVLLSTPPSADEGPRHLFVVNANFDLRYNAGSLQAYDLDAVDAAIAKCADRDQLGATTCQIDSQKVLTDEVLVPSLTTYMTAASDRSRIYISSRTDMNLTVIDLDESRDRPLSCGDSNRRCDEKHMSWTDPLADSRDVSIPPEPVGITAGSARDIAPGDDTGIEGQFVMIAHRGGDVTAFLDRGRGTQLELQDVLAIGGSTHPIKEPTGITFDPTTHLAYVSVYARGTLDIGAKKLLARVGVSPASNSDEPSTLYDAGVVTLEGVSLGRNLHGVAINEFNPGEALVVSRAPASIMWVDMAGPLSGQSDPTQAFVRHTTTIGGSPSRVVSGALGDRKLVVVSCFDSREIFILDADTAETLSVVHNLSGPFEVALDSARKRLYVADFRSSVIRILDLAPLLDGASETVPTGRIIATLGRPQLVQELQ